MRQSRNFLQSIIHETLYGAPRTHLLLQNRLRNLQDYTNWVNSDDRTRAWTVLDYMTLADLEANLKILLSRIHCVFETSFTIGRGKC